MTLPSAPDLDQLPLATATPAPLPALDGFTFEGYRNRDGSVGTKNVLGIMSTVQCAAPTLEYAVRRIKAEILPRYRGVDDVVAITTPYGCGVAINAPGAQVPIRTLRNMALNPNLGGEVMSVSLGCEKLQPSVLAGDAFPILPERTLGGASARRTISLLRRHGCRDHALRRDASGETQPPHAHLLPGLGAERGLAVRGQRCLLRGDGQSRSGLCGGPAGARRSHGDVLRGDGSSRRGAPGYAPRGECRGGAGVHPGNGLVRRILAPWRRRPQRQSHARKQKRRAGQHCREIAGIGGQGRQHGADGGCQLPASAYAARAWYLRPLRPAISFAEPCKPPPA